MKRMALKGFLSLQMIERASNLHRFSYVPNRLMLKVDTQQP